MDDESSLISNLYEQSSQAISINNVIVGRRGSQQP